MSAKIQARLRAARAKLNLTQQQLAALLGVALRNIENWEQNTATPRGLALEALESKLAALLRDAGK